jgi:hypothetical protein
MIQKEMRIQSLTKAGMKKTTRLGPAVSFLHNARATVIG